MQFSFKPEDFSWLNELIDNLVEKPHYWEKIIIKIEKPKDFLIRTLAYGYRNRLEVDPINKKKLWVMEIWKKDGDTSYNYISSRLKERFDFKLDIAYMKTNYDFFLEALIEPMM